MFDDDILPTIQRKSNEGYEKLLEEALEPYGINRQNLEEMAHRVNIIRQQSFTDLFRTIDEVYIDGRYAFSIRKTLRYEERAPGVMAMVADAEIVKGEN